MDRVVEIYVASELWAAPLVEAYLGQFGIDSVVRANGVSVYPMSIGPLSGFRVGVRERKKKVALRLLAQAIRDGIIPGELLPPSEDLRGSGLTSL